MSEAKEKEEAGQDVPLSVEESQQLVDAQVQTEALVVSVPVEEPANHVGNGKVKIEALVEDKNAKPEAYLEGIQQQDVQHGESTLHSVPVEDNAQVLNKTKCEQTPGKSEVEEVRQSDKGIENDANVCQDNVDSAETAVEVKPKACEVADSKTCNDDDTMPSSHNEPVTPQAVPAVAKAEIKNVLEIENKDNEKQVHVAPADNGNLDSKQFCFLDADHSYDGNESGTDEQQSTFTKELQNFFRERTDFQVL